MLSNQYLFVIAGVLATLCGLYLLARTLLLLIVGIRTKAMISNPPGSFPQIKYTAGDKLIEKRFRRQLSNDDEEVLPAYRSVDILYHPQKPRFYVIRSAWSLAGEPLICLVVGLGSLYAGLHITG